MKNKRLLVGLLASTVWASSLTIALPNKLNTAQAAPTTLAKVTYKETATSQLGQLKTANSRIYTEPGSKKSIAASTQYTNEIFYIFKKAVTTTGDTYYLISRQSNANATSIGWVKAKSILVQPYAVQTNVKKTRYIKGTGAGYTRPGGLQRNVILPSLASYKNAPFVNVMTAKVGKVLWYRSTINGNVVWLPKSELLDKKPAVVIPAPVVTNVSRIARLKNAQVVVLKNVEKKESAVATKNYVNRSLQVTKQAKYNGASYYLLTDKGAEVGWVKEADVTGYTYKVPSQVNSTRYLTGGGYAYTMPWGANNDIVLKSLKSLKDTPFVVTAEATVGNSVWYFGTTSTGKSVWVAGNRTTTEKPIVVIPAPVVTDESRIARLEDENVQVLANVEKEDSEVNIAAYVNRSLQVTKKATYDGDTYYLLLDKGVAIGWVNEDDVNSYSYVAPTPLNSTRYLTGGGYAYTMPWGATNDIVLKSLTSLKDTPFIVTAEATVGNSVWYFGTTSTGKSVWVAGNRTTEEKPVDPSTPEYTNVLRQGTLTSKAILYTNLAAMSTRDITAAEKTEVFAINRSAKIGTDTYYELKRTSAAGKTTIVGWVLAQNTSTIAVSKPVSTNDVLYITGVGGGAGYSIAGTESASNRLIDSLTNYGAKQFKATQYQTISKITYYYGKLGTKYVWIKENQFGQPYQYVNLRKKSQVTQADMEAYLIKKKGPSIVGNNLYKTIPVFLDMEKRYGISAQFMLAHAIVETGWGSSAISQFKNNFFGYQAYDSCAMTCAMYFPTGTDGIQYYADAIFRKYLQPGAIYNNGTTAAGMNVKYATDKSWATTIARLMGEMKAYDATYYENAVPSTISPTLPAFNYSNVIPNGKPKPNTYNDFEVGITATTTTIARARLLPYQYGKVVQQYAPNTKIFLSGTHNDVVAGWMRVTINGEEAWISRSEIKIDNLAQVTSATAANVRDKASVTNSTVISTIPVGGFFKLQVDESNKVVTQKDSNNTIWYSVAVTDPVTNTSTIGWISSTIVKVHV